MIIGNRDVKNTDKPITPNTLEDNLKEDEPVKGTNETAPRLTTVSPRVSGSPLSPWIKPRTTYCKDIDVFESAVTESNQFNGEWFTQIQLTVKKEMSWINDGTIRFKMVYDDAARKRRTHSCVPCM